MSVDWISKIELSENREHQIRRTFSYASVEFHYPNDIAEFETILDLLKDNKTVVNIENNDFEIGENDLLDRLIIMDDVNGLADKSMEFSSFLTVSRKYRYTCVYIFHITFLHMSNWQMILSQTKIFNIFPSAIQLGNMSKILTNNCDRDTNFKIAKKNYSCLTIDCGKSGSSKYRTEADNNLKQTCYFTENKEINLNKGRCELTFTIQTAILDTIKERHLPYNKLLTKNQNNEPDNKNDDRSSTKRKNTMDQRDHKEQCNRSGTKTRKRPRFLLSR